MSGSWPRRWRPKGNQVLIWDRPNCGESDVCFTGASESAMQADTLAALLDAPRHGAGGDHRRVGRCARLDAHRGAAPRGRGRARDVVDQRRRVRAHEPGHALLRAVNLVTAWERRHGGRRRAARVGGGARAQPVEPPALPRPGPARVHRDDGAVDARVLPVRRRARSRARPTPMPRALDLPTLVFRSGESDAYHTRATSEQVAAALPNARLVEPPWGDREWIERSARPRR